MDDSERGTKERILKAALDLFCVNGYTTVSVRDIGRAVGIRESSIYYHFTNKEDILQTMLRQAEQWTQVKKDRFNAALSSVSKVDCGEFINAGVAYLEDYLLEENIYKLIRVLTIEKQRNEDAAGMYRKLLFTMPLEHQKKVFSLIMERGAINEDNPEELAAEYQAIILYVFQKYFSAPNVFITEAKPAARKELTTLLKRFFVHYFREGA